jgi:hypothetical protein
MLELSNMQEDIDE